MVYICRVHQKADLQLPIEIGANLDSFYLQNWQNCAAFNHGNLADL